MQNFSLKVSKLGRISQVEKKHHIAPVSKDSLAVAEESHLLLLTSGALFPPHKDEILICNVLGDKLIKFS